MPSYKAAIEAMYRNCIYDEACPGTWREQVKDCTCAGCPLYELRPQPISVIRSGSKRHNLSLLYSATSSIRPEAGVQDPLRH